jgi:hypothetical protein
MDDTSTPRKVAKTAGISFVFDRDDFEFAGLTAPVAFNNAITMATDILWSDEFAASFIELTGLETNSQQIREALSQPFTIKQIRQKTYINCFALVFRATSLTTIHFNPILLLNINRRYATNPHPSVLNIHVWFLGIKLVHEITHLLYGLLSPAGALAQTPPKDLPDDATTSTSTAGTTKYDDLGTMMEKKLFGGVIELKAINDSLLMEPELIGWYPSTSTPLGRLLDADRSTWAPVKIVLGAHFTSKHVPFISAVAMKVSGGRASQAAGCEKEDIDEDDDEEGGRA